MDDTDLALEGARRTAEDDWPEHNRMKAISESERQAIGAFIKWMGGQGWELATWSTMEHAGFEHCIGCDGTACSDSEYALIPTGAYFDPTKMMADYYGIDLAALDREKRMMLAAMRLKDHQRKVLKKRPRTKIPTDG